jgi:hypothetical protein
MFAALAALLVPAFAWAQANSASIPPSNVPLLPVSGGNAAVEPPTYEVPLTWNERADKVLSISITNDSRRALKIYGTQATGGIFVVDYPADLAPGKTDTISFVHNAPDNTDNECDLISLLTDQGIRIFRLNMIRQNAASLSSRELTWTQGGSADTKTVTLTVVAGTVIPQKIRTTGGNTAVLEKVNATTWAVRVTPASTAKSGKFAVFVDFDQPLPGQAVVILGVIQSQH